MFFETDIVRDSNPKSNFTLLGEMLVQRGDKSDWNLLHDLHYKAENLPIGPRFWKLTLHDETIGVMVTGSPKGLLKERHMVFPKMKPTSGESVLTNTKRYKWINQNFRVISRFVVDTMYRGVGCGYRMMNIASRMEGSKYMEIQSSMSKFNYFGQKAGFRFVRPINANKYESGLQFFRSHFTSSPQDSEAMIQELNAKSPEQAEALLQACRDFYYRNSALELTGNNRSKGQGRVDSMPASTIIKALQQITLASPMYGIWTNPDIGRKLPDVLPLTAFDNQPVDQPLELK